MTNVHESDEAEADKRASGRTKAKFDPDRKLKPGPSVAQLKDRHSRLKGAKISLKTPRTAKGTDKEVEEAVYAAYKNMAHKIDEVISAVAARVAAGTAKVVGKVGSAVVKGGAEAIKQRAVAKQKEKMVNRVRGVEEGSEETKKQIDKETESKRLTWQATRDNIKSWKGKGSPKSDKFKSKITKLKEAFAGKMASKLGGEQRGKTVSKDPVVTKASASAKDNMDKKIGKKTNPKGKDMVQAALNRRQAAARRAGKGTEPMSKKDLSASRD